MCQEEIKPSRYSAEISITESDECDDFESVLNSVGPGGVATDNVFKEIAFPKQDLLKDVVGNISEYAHKKLKREIGMRNSLHYEIVQPNL